MDEVDDFLAHYGVPGMKWGIRRQLKKQASQNVRDFGISSQPRMAYVSREISEEEYKSLSSKPIKLGRQFSRIGDRTGNLRDIVYVTKDADDHNRYKALISPNGKRTGKKFDISISTEKSLVSPSMKERVDTYIKLLDEQVPSKNGKSTVSGREYLFGEHPAVRGLNSREVGLRSYQAFAQTQHVNNSLHTEYFNRLKSKGYNAVIDDADREFMSKLPVIIFPRESGARVTEIKPITKDDVLIAKSELKLLD